MDQKTLPSTYDYRQYDRIWQRVSPNLNPYPGAAAPAMEPVPGVPSTPPSSSEGTLPGAVENPCCMGSAAMEMLEVLKGFIEEELEDRSYYLAFARQAPSWARQALRDTAAVEAAHARRLMAVYYLITGECYHPALACGSICVGALCPALRNRYHEEACQGLNYIRAAEGTTDPCLTKLLTEFSQDEYRNADRMMELLERALRN